MKLQWLDVLLLGLATYRLALAISKEDGPWWMFKYFRRSVKRNAPKSTHLDEGIECIFCVSLQFGILMAIAWRIFHGNVWFEMLVLAFALSAVSVILNQAFTKGKL